MPKENNHLINPTAVQINSIARRLFEKLAHFFPVCMASDEFHFFPQIRSAEHDWSRWDNFSADAISEISRYLKEQNHDLQNLNANDLTVDDHIDVYTLIKIITIVYEQLSEVKLYLYQPTFYLTILGIGLADAIEAGENPLNARMKNLPGFLDHARYNLVKIPEIFRDMGCEMISQLKPWLRSLKINGAFVSPVIRSLERFNDHLKEVSVTSQFLLPTEQFDRIAFYHMGCGMETDDISRQIDQEITETRSILDSLSEKISPKKTWEKTIDSLPRPSLDSGGVKQLYCSTISKLADHCLQNGFLTHDIKIRCPVAVEEVPDYLLPVRNNAAYSMPPGHPAKGGTFYIMSSDDKLSVPPDYQLLTAHETFPGHHLLDTHRWSLKRSLRRHIEFPIFYEGWASFSEELLFDTGFFNSLTDKLLIAKRRYWRALRGRIDLDIHTRKRNLSEAAGLFAAHGMDHNKAVAIIKRYILKPGYQLSYTMGRCYFKDLYERFKKNEKEHIPSRFACQVLSQGEIGFDHLKKIILKGGDL